MIVFTIEHLHINTTNKFVNTSHKITHFFRIAKHYMTLCSALLVLLQNYLSSRKVCGLTISDIWVNDF